MNNTLAAFKRRVNDKNKNPIKLEVISYYGSHDNIPEKLKGVREVINCNTACFNIQNANGSPSRLDVPRAALFEWDTQNNIIRIYNSGSRTLTAQEKKILNDWKAIEQTESYQKQSNIDAISDGSSCYWKQKRFFEERNAEYLMGTVKQKGAMLMPSLFYNGEPKCVQDDNVKGDIVIEYRVHEA